LDLGDTLEKIQLTVTYEILNMRHGNKVNNLGRKSAHRKAMLSNMASSLILHKRISTTVAKAKALRGYVEPLLTKSKTDTTHSRRIVFSYLQNKEIVTELFRDVAPKIADRTGGYTRIIRTGYRLGDNAEMCIIELVDFNEIYTNEKAKKTTRRSRRGGKAGSEETVAATEVEAKAEEVVEVTEEPTSSEEPAADTESSTDEESTDEESTEEK
jgi:large subunit ribosomal protein L17